MPREAFYKLLYICGSDLHCNSTTASRSSGGFIDPAVRLAICLRLLTGSSYLDLVQTFNVSAAAVYAICMEVVHVICRKLPMPRLPLTDVLALYEISKGFRSSRLNTNLLGDCMGALDGIAIEVHKPRD